MPYMEFLDAAGHAIRIDVTDGTYTRTVDGAVVDTHPATAEEQSNFGAALPPVPPTPAQADIVALQEEVPSWRQQIAADMQAVAGGWDTLTADQRTQLMLRVLGGFGTAMQGLLAHATITGAIPAA